MASVPDDRFPRDVPESPLRGRDESPGLRQAPRWQGLAGTGPLGTARCWGFGQGGHCAV